MKQGRDSMKSMIFKTLTLLMALSLFQPGAFAEELIFTNGDRISGEIVSMRGGTFEVETPGFGRIAVPKSGLLRINFNNEAPTRHQGGSSIITPDDLLSFIQNCKLNFYIDSEKTSANNFANTVRLNWAMKAPGMKDLGEFGESFLYYSRTGSHNMVEISKGKKIKVCDWIDSVVKSSASRSSASPAARDAGRGGGEDEEDTRAPGEKKFKKR